MGYWMVWVVMVWVIDGKLSKANDPRGGDSRSVGLLRWNESSGDFCEIENGHVDLRVVSGNSHGNLRYPPPKKLPPPRNKKALFALD